MSMKARLRKKRYSKSMHNGFRKGVPANKELLSNGRNVVGTAVQSYFETFWL